MGGALRRAPKSALEGALPVGLHRKSLESTPKSTPEGTPISETTSESTLGSTFGGFPALGFGLCGKSTDTQSKSWFSMGFKEGSDLFDHHLFNYGR